MEDLYCWGKPIHEVLKHMRINFCPMRNPVHNARVLFFNSKPGSAQEEVASILWRHFTLKKLETVSSFTEAHKVFSEARNNSEEHMEAFISMLSHITSKEEAITAYQCAPKNTQEHVYAETKLAEFE